MGPKPFGESPQVQGKWEEKMEFKLGIIGARHAHLHASLGGLIKTGQVKVVGVAEEKESVRGKACQDFSTEGFSDYHEMLEKGKPQIVCVGMPNGTKASVILECLQKGLHVVCPKPVALVKEEYFRIEEELKKAGLQILVGAPYRYSPLALKLKIIVDQGILGDLIYGMIDLPHRLIPEKRDEYFFDHNLYGGIVMDIGYNAVDFLTWINQSPVVQAQGFRSSRRYKDRNNFIDNAQIVIRLENGFCATLGLDWITPDGAKGDIKRVALKGRKGLIEGIVDPVHSDGPFNILCTEEEVHHEIPIASPSDVPPVAQEFLDAIGKVHLQTYPRSLLLDHPLLLSRLDDYNKNDSFP